MAILVKRVFVVAKPLPSLSSVMLILHVTKAQESANVPEAQDYRDQLLAVGMPVAVLHSPIIYMYMDTWQA